MQKKHHAGKSAGKTLKSVLLAFNLIALLTSHLLGYAPLYIPLIYLMFSLITYLLYAKDKRAAKRGRWRVKETTLHFFALIGGWPGAIVAQEHLRHKTQKRSFRHVFWMTVGVNAAALIFLHSPKGSYFLHDITRKIEYFAVAHVDSKTAVAVVVYLTEYRVFF